MCLMMEMTLSKGRRFDALLKPSLRLLQIDVRSPRPSKSNVGPFAYLVPTWKPSPHNVLPPKSAEPFHGNFNFTVTSTQTRLWVMLLQFIPPTIGGSRIKHHGELSDSNFSITLNTLCHLSSLLRRAIFQSSLSSPVQ